YCHPDKILSATRLPGTLTEDAIAALYGTDAATYRALRADLAAAAASPPVDGSPFAPGSTILALGDSITDDLGSWAEILRRALPEVTIVNAGLSGDTTTGAIARLSRLALRATWALVLLGTNDARRHGDAPMLVSHAETRRNLRILDGALRRCCRHIRWITPPPIFQPVDADSDLRWEVSDIAAKAQLVRALDPTAIDLWPGFTPEHLCPDGLHPSPAGQRFIAARVVSVRM
ncbi:MAG TPA: GDSL-type esterase/lipase family protein, partial [Solirubrobacteraceae bacterium]|nr:GDSL-type esterase/lipase family protein [Solirubrobacteraceae bacterium]